MPHKHRYLMRRPNATVEVCACGSFRYTAHGLATLPIVVEAERKEKK